MSCYILSFQTGVCEALHLNGPHAPTHVLTKVAGKITLTI